MDRNLRLTDLKNQLQHFTDQNNKLHDELIVVQKTYDQVIQLFNNIPTSSSANIIFRLIIL